MFALSRFDAPTEGEVAFAADLAVLLAALAQRPGFQRGQVGRALDEPTTLVLQTEWDSPGSYRRALSDHGVRLLAMPLLVCSRDEASAFEVLSSHQEPVPAALGPSSRAR